MKKLRLILLMAIAANLVSLCCNPVKLVSKHLTGSWTIIEARNQNPGEAESSSKQAGTIVLNPDKTGFYKVSHDIFGTPANVATEFKWSNSENIITLKNNNDEVIKSWIIMKLKKRRQEWKSTMGSGSSQVVVMKRLK